VWAPIATSAIQAVGSIVSGVGQHQAALGQAGADRQNARLAEWQGRSEASVIRERARRLSGENRAAIGASGVDIAGSFLDALADSDINAELDRQTALWNRKVEAENHRYRARQTGVAGQGAVVGAFLGAGAQAIQGYGNWKMMSASSQAGGGRTAP
jgi:hypothetical protein